MPPWLHGAWQLLLSACSSLSFLYFFFIPPFGFFLPPLFLHLCFLGTKSSRLVSENTINKMNHDTESLLIHNVRGWYDERVARRRSPSSLSVGGGVVTVEDLYIYTYIYIYMYMWIYIYIYSGTQMAAQSMRRRGNLSQEENQRVCMEGLVGRSGRVVGSAVPHGPACPQWAENSKNGKKKGLGDQKNREKKKRRLSCVASSAGSLGFVLLLSLFLSFPNSHCGLLRGLLLLSPSPGGLAGYSLNSYDYFRKR